MAHRARGIGKSIRSSRQSVLCDLLVAARKRAGLTQEEVAKRLKRPQSFVAKFEGGERRLDVVEFLTIAEAIEADPVRIIRKLMRRTD
jgi:transcriptional regulator with XRE-family HTH domain